jgi:2-polyprenyl-3-methyl-5-hydroxy-6-metoxy-1,4-benzoquinol methylase
MTAPERILPHETEPGIVAYHRKRYEFALPLCAGKEVLDAGCGAGYGSALLGGAARRVVGVDRDEAAVAYARDRYAGENVSFQIGDLVELGFEDDSFDVVCAFEVIEHLPDAARHLAEAARVLRPDGVYVVSTPRVDRTTHAPANPHHEVEYSRADFARLLAGHFAEVELYGQARRQTTRHRLMQRVDVIGLRRRLPFLRPAARLLGTRPMADLSSDEVVISRDEADSGQELVAICREPR